ncbi:MAG TPA: hypothetical protein VEZ90_01285 [Blastocatellia bacterium]|nr:hypothetical protein [Blastocatellia bacterium]
MSDLAEWNNFYVITGSASGALIGLQFVVMTLIADRPALHKADAGAAFATPTIVHFGVVLLLSALINVPWHQVAPVSVVWGFVGAGGIIYSVVVTLRLRLQTTYRPVSEDWLFHALLPFAGYAMILGSACVVLSRMRPALFVSGGATLLLLFIGIHNAWDAVTYHVFTSRPEQDEE